MIVEPILADLSDSARDWWQVMSTRAGVGRGATWRWELWGGGGAQMTLEKPAEVLEKHQSDPGVDQGAHRDEDADGLWDAVPTWEKRGEGSGLEVTGAARSSYGRGARESHGGEGHQPDVKEGAGGEPGAAPQEFMSEINYASGCQP